MIYFLRRSDGTIKIGTTQNYRIRIPQLISQYGELELVGLIEGGRETEQSLHLQFAEHRIGRTEFFVDHDALREFIAANAVIDSLPIFHRNRVFKRVDKSGSHPVLTHRKFETPQLEAWYWFQKTALLLVERINQELEATQQISIQWYDVLIELYEAPDHRLRLHELAEKVLLSRSGLTRLVDRLETAGYLLREVDPADRRGFYAIITEHGIDAMRHAWPIYARGIKQHFAAELSADEAELFARVCARILERTRSNR